MEQSEIEALNELSKERSGDPLMEEEEKYTSMQFLN